MPHINDTAEKVLAGARAGQSSASGGLDYAAVGQAVSRFGRRLGQQRERQRKLAETERQLSNVEGVLPKPLG